MPEEAPFGKDQLVFLDEHLRWWHPYLTMSGLWDLRIPTLEDNNHLVTPPFHFLVSRALSRSQDYHSRNWATVTLARPALMAALGVRFLLTDRIQSDPQLILRTQQAGPDGVPILLYEIRRTNLGDYSPTQTIVSADAGQTVSLMRDESFAFPDVAIVDTPIIDHLSRATRSEMYFEKGGVRVRAESDGPALLVLPVQFSNSLRVVETALSSKQAPVRFLRVNLLETGLLFDGRIDVKFAHIFGPLRGVEGRLRDIEDCRRLGICETGEIPYPPGYQPFGPQGGKLDRGLYPKGDGPEAVEAFLRAGEITGRITPKKMPPRRAETFGFGP